MSGKEGPIGKRSRKAKATSSSNPLNSLEPDDAQSHRTDDSVHSSLGDEDGSEGRGDGGGNTSDHNSHTGGGGNSTPGSQTPRQFVNTVSQKATVIAELNSRTVATLTHEQQSLNANGNVSSLWSRLSQVLWNAIQTIMFTMPHVWPNRNPEMMCMSNPAHIDRLKHMVEEHQYIGKIILIYQKKIY